MIKILLLDGVTLQSYPADLCNGCLGGCSSIIEKCPLDKKRRRQTEIKYEYGLLWECTSIHGYVQSQQVHEKSLANRVGLIFIELDKYNKKLTADYEKRYIRLQHNLVSNNAHIIQEFLAVIREKDIIDARNPVKLIQSALISKPFEISQAFLKMYLGAISIQHEILVWEMMGNNKFELKPDYHELHRIFLQLFYKFRTELLDNKIKCTIGKFTGSVFVDYDSAAVVLYCIMHNAVKYTYQETEITCDFIYNNNRAGIVLDMISILITKHDLEHIFDEGYSGIFVKTSNKQGKGFGMSIAKAIGDKADIQIRIAPSFTALFSVDKIDYAKNKFIISFPLKPNPAKPEPRG